MTLGTQLGLDPGHIALDVDLAPLPPNGHRPYQFLAHICCSQIAGWINVYTTNRDIFIAIPTFQKLSSNGRFPLLSKALDGLHCV